MAAMALLPEPDAAFVDVARATNDFGLLAFWGFADQNDLCEGTNKACTNDYTVTTKKARASNRDVLVRCNVTKPFKEADTSPASHLHRLKF